MRRSRGLALVPLLAVWACGDDRPPPPPVLDGGGGGHRDGGPEMDGGPTGGRRDGGPVLPPADLTVVLPYGGPEVEHAIDVQASAAELDVFLSVDTTGSFGEEIDALQSDLVSRVLPAIRERAEEVAVGVGRFEDFPVSPFGSESDRPFTLLSGITTSEARASSALAALDDPLGQGGDTPESSAEALYQIATGDGFRLLGMPIVASYDHRSAPGGGTIGGVGFRDRSLRVVVHVTDAPSHGPADYGASVPGAHSLDDAITALAALEAHVIGIASGAPARPLLERLALDTGAFVVSTDGSCATGIGGAPRPATGGICPLVFDIDADGTGLGDTLVDAILGLHASVGFDASWGEAVDDRLAFVRAIEARSAEPPDGAPAPAQLDERPADGIDDTFAPVAPGTMLHFVVRLANRTIPPADYDQLFRVEVVIWGDDLVLARRTIRIEVPRGRLLLDGGPDASTGTDAGTSATDGGGDGG